MKHKIQQSPEWAAVLEAQRRWREADDSDLDESARLAVAASHFLDFLKRLLEDSADA